MRFRWNDDCEDVVVILVYKTLQVPIEREYVKRLSDRIVLSESAPMEDFDMVYLRLGPDEFYMGVELLW